MSTATSIPSFVHALADAARPNRWGVLACLALAGAIGALSWQARLPMPALPGSAPAIADGVAAQRLKPLDSGARQLRFEPNRGQSAAGVRYVARGPSQQVAIFDDGMAFTATRPQTRRVAQQGNQSEPDEAAVPTVATAQLRLIKSRRGGEFIELEALPSRSHHLIGRDETRWQHALPQFKQLRYPQAYPGIDLVYYSREGEFEFDFVVMPGADPRAIRLQISSPSPGAAKPLINAQGELLLDGEGGLLRIKKPVLYQHIDGQKVSLDASWLLRANGELGFALPAYDKRHVLVIDPVFKLLHSTYLGGVHDDQVGGLALDAQGNAYIIGNSGSEDWPVSGNAYQTRRKNLGVYVRNVVVTKFDAAGTLLWSTFLGGSVNDYGSAIAIDAAGQVVIGGTTTSTDFPTTAGAHQNTLRGGTSGFVAVLSPDGSTLVQSTLYGGTGTAGVNALALDGAGNVVISGNAGPGLATTAGAYKTTLSTGTAAYVARFSASTGGPLQLLAASYYGTDTPESNASTTGNIVHGMTLDASGAAWIAGQAFTTRLPTTANALQTAPAEIDLSCRSGVSPLNSFAYVARLSPDLKTLPFASYLSGKQRVPGQQVCSEFAISIKLDAAGDVYVHGGTGSDKFPTTAGTPQPVYPGNNGFTGYSAFITKIKGDAPRVLWSSYLGGNGGNTFAGRMALDAGTGSLWLPLVTGGGANFPITTDAQQKTYGGGSSDAALVQLDASTGALKYSSFMGGGGDDVGMAVAIDGGGNAFVAGTTNSRDFAVTGNAFQPAYTAGAYDGADWFFRIVGSGTIGRVQPSTLGIGGSATLTIAATGVDPAAQVQLVRGTSVIEATAVTVDANTGKVQATMPLRQAEAGAYDLVIVNADGRVLRKTQAVTLASGGRPDVTVVVVARPAVRTGVPQTYNFVVTNAGNADAYFTRLWITFPASMTHRIQGLGTDPDSPNVQLSDLAVAAHEFDSLKYLPLIAPLLRAGTSETFSLELTSTADSPGLSVNAFVRPPWFDDRQAALAAFSSAEGNPDGLSRVCIASAEKSHLRDCLGEYVLDMADTVVSQYFAVPTETEGVDTAPAVLDALSLRALKVEVVRRLRDSLDQALTAGQLTNRAGAESRARALAIQRGRVQPQFPPAGPILVWIAEQAAAFGFGKWLESLLPKPTPPVHAKPDPKRLINVTVKKGRCLPGGFRKDTIVREYINPHGFTYLTEQVRCGKECSQPGSGGGSGGGGNSGAAQALAHAFGANNGEGLAALSLRVRPLAAGGSCPNPPPDECPAVGNPNNNGSGSSGGSCGSSAGAIDPNDKFGASGDGSASHWLRQAMPLPYQIAFENLPTATLPAAEVVVTDQLDPAKVDFSTLTLGNISWGPYRIDVPAGLNTYSTMFPINASMSVRVAGSLNPTTGLLKWTFTTIDPVTKLPPSDPTLGFLPPNKNGTEGQGYVNFTISPKAGLGDGTQWANFASIVFDRNAAIVTPTWVNTLDTTAPFSRVASVTQKATGTDLDVTWSGTDTGSGVRRYTVYVSDNGGAFSAWQSNVTTTSATYTGGVIGHTYGFNVVATDGAGNVEATRLAADTSATVRDTTPAPPVTPPASGGGGGGCSIATAGDQRDASLPLLLATAFLVLVWRRRLAARAARR